MGKAEEQHTLPPTTDSQRTEQNADNICRVRGSVGFRCVLALILGVAVLLSALFWFPPFLHYGDQKDLDLGSRYRDYDMVATFMLEKPVSSLQGNILSLEIDILTEIEAPTIKVEILSLKSLAGSNITEVVFAVVPIEKNLELSSTARSLVRASFASLVTNQYLLRLTKSLFGNPFSFEVLKFSGGITIIPTQGAFLLQKVQVLFNFTLNFSVSQLQDNFNELTRQLKLGLRLATYENLYIKLTNSKGSTVAPPTTIQASVILAVGNAPSLARLKQLAETITGHHAKNLGLNNSVFGRVKQVRLSSILQHSLGDDASPTPSPLPHPHHHHHHHHHHHDARLTPSVAPAPATKFNAPPAEKISPAPAPTPLTGRSRKASPPGCQFGYTRRFPRKANKRSHMVAPVAPPIPPRYTASSPHQEVNPPAAVPYKITMPSPSPKAVLAHVQPPTSSNFDAEPPDITPSVSPSPSSSCAFLPTTLWLVLQFLVVLHL